jgi:hypothetical protein
VRHSIACSAVALSLFTPALALAQTATEDVETAPKPSAPGTPGEAELPFYIPPSSIAFVAPPPPPPLRTGPTDEEKLQGKTLELNIEPAFFVGSNASGSSPGVSALARITWPGVGFDIGYMAGLPIPDSQNASGALLVSQSSAFVLGFSFIHYGIELYDRGENHLYLTLPEIDVRALFAGGSALVMDVGGSLLGLRFGHCLGRAVSFVAEVRGPTAFAYIPILFDGSSISPYASVGVSLAIGIGF